jgi:hypothetical protein
VNRALTFTAPGASSILAKSTADAAKVGASQRITQVEPIAATRTPPSAGPATFTVFCPIFSSEFAACRISAGTTSTTMPPAAGGKNADAAPQAADIATRCHTRAVPVYSSTTAKPSATRSSGAFRRAGDPPESRAARNSSSHLVSHSSHKRERTGARESL